MNTRTPFFLRFTISFVLGLVSGYEHMPWVILLLFPLVFLQRRLIIYSAAFLAGFVLSIVKNEIPVDAIIFEVKIKDLRTPKLAIVEVQRYLNDRAWYDHSERILIFSADSLPAYGTIICRTAVGRGYGARKVEAFELINQDTSWMDAWRINLRQRLAGRVDPDVLGIAYGIVLGDKSGISSDTYNMYKYAGGAHILAVSGLHVGIVYGVIQLLLNPLGNRHRWRLIKLICLLLMLWGYAMITGFSPSVIRAAGFFTFFSVARHRCGNLWHTISLLLFVVLVWNPGNLYMVGLQLSYLAVMGIMLFQPIFNRFMPTVKNPYRWIYASVSVSLSAQLLTFPVVAYYFGGVSLAGLFTAIFLIPFAFLVIVLVVLLLISPAIMLPPLNAILVWMTGIVHNTLGRVNSWPLAYVSWEIESFSGYYALLVLVFMALKWPTKITWLLLLLGLILLLARQ